MPFERDPNDLGALWVKSGARGEYMTGTINGVRVVVFRNTKKSSDKAPDWRVLKAQPRNVDAPTNAAPEPSGTFEADDDIPF